MFWIEKLIKKVFDMKVEWKREKNIIVNILEKKYVKYELVKKNWKVLE